MFQQMADTTQNSSHNDSLKAEQATQIAKWQQNRAEFTHNAKKAFDDIQPNNEESINLSRYIQLKKIVYEFDQDDSQNKRRMHIKNNLGHIKQLVSACESEPRYVTDLKIINEQIKNANDSPNDFNVYDFIYHIKKLKKIFKSLLKEEIWNDYNNDSKIMNLMKQAGFLQQHIYHMISSNPLEMLWIYRNKENAKTMLHEHTQMIEQVLQREQRILEPLKVFLNSGEIKPLLPQPQNQNELNSDTEKVKPILNIIKDELQYYSSDDKKEIVDYIKNELLVRAKLSVKQKVRNRALCFEEAFLEYLQLNPVAQNASSSASTDSVPAAVLAAIISSPADSSTSAATPTTTTVPAPLLNATSSTIATKTSQPTKPILNVASNQLDLIKIALENHKKTVKKKIKQEYRQHCGFFRNRSRDLTAKQIQNFRAATVEEFKQKLIVERDSLRTTAPNSSLAKTLDNILAEDLKDVDLQQVKDIPQFNKDIADMLLQRIAKLETSYGYKFSCLFLKSKSMLEDHSSKAFTIKQLGYLADDILSCRDDDKGDYKQFQITLAKVRSSIKNPSSDVKKLLDDVKSLVETKVNDANPASPTPRLN